MRRSMLFLPGNTPNIIVNGEVLGSDAVILPRLQNTVQIVEIKLVIQLIACFFVCKLYHVH